MYHNEIMYDTFYVINDMLSGGNNENVVVKVCNYFKHVGCFQCFVLFEVFILNLTPYKESVLKQNVLNNVIQVQLPVTNTTQSVSFRYFRPFILICH